MPANSFKVWMLRLVTSLFLYTSADYVQNIIISLVYRYREG